MNTQRMRVTSRIVARTDDEINSCCAIVHYDDSYAGRVCVIRLDEVVAVLPNPIEALKVAAFAITPNGGFGSVALLAAENEFPTHDSFVQWLDYQ